MNISVRLNDNCVDLSQKDINDIWDYFTYNVYWFINRVTVFIDDIGLEEHKELLRPLYEKLKEYYEKN